MMQYLRKNVRKIMIVIVVLFVLSCFAGYGMYSGGGAGAESEGTIKDYAVATIDGEKVMRSTMDYEMAQFIQARGLAQTISDDDLPAIRSMILDQMAITKELDKEVKARNVTLSKEDVDATIKEIEAAFPTREIFLQEIQRAGLDEKALRADVEEQMRRQAVFEQVVAPASTDQQEMRTFYDTLKEYAFRKPEGFMLNIAHFATEEAAKTAREKIKGGEQWDDVMAAASGDIINHLPFENPVLVPTSEMNDNVEFLKDAPMNEVTEPVMLTSDDFMIVVKRSKQEAGTAEYDEVSADLEGMILNQKRQGLQSQFLQELRARAVVDMLDEELFKKPEVQVEGDESAPAEKDDVSEEPAAGSPDVTAESATVGDAEKGDDASKEEKSEAGTEGTESKTP